MLQPIYIQHSFLISPQITEGFNILAPYTPTSLRMPAIAPQYKSYINPVQLRRLNTLQKMGIYAGMQCIDATQQPDAIIVGTSKGSMTDTEKFVKDLSIYKEEMLNPMPFIASTYNAVNGSIALAAKNTAYNQTFVNRGSSFENALYDAQIRLQHPTTQYALVGAVDEITDEYFHLKNKLGYWRTNSDFSDFYHPQHGSIAGENCGFFMLHNNPQLAHQAVITKVTSLYKPNIATIISNINEHIIATAKVAIVLGENGDLHDQAAYDSVRESVPNDVAIVRYKHLCGDGETSGTFALWLSVAILNEGDLPESIWNRKELDNYDTIIIYNHYRNINHNIIVIKKGS